MKSKARNPSKLADEVCEAIKILTAHRTSQTYATQWIMAGEVRRHLGVKSEPFEAALRLAIEQRLSLLKNVFGLGIG